MGTNLLQVMYSLNDTITSYGEAVQESQANNIAPVINLPPLLDYDQVKTSYERSFDFESVIQKQTAGSPIYHNPMRHWIDQHENVKPTLAWVTPTLITAASVIAVIVVIIIGILVKFQKAKSILAALSIPSFSEAAPTAAPAICVMNQMWLKIILAGIFLFSVLTIIVYICCRVWKLRKMLKNRTSHWQIFSHIFCKVPPVHSTEMHLEIMSEQYQVRLPIGSVPMPIYKAELSVSKSPPTFKFTHGWNPHLLIAWQNTEIHLQNAVQEWFVFKLNSIVPIAFWEKKTIKHILTSKQFTLSFVMGKANNDTRHILGTVINKTPPTWVESTSPTGDCE